MTLLDRRLAASRAIAAWKSAHPKSNVPVLKFALPAGPGGRLLFALVRSDLLRIGVEAVAADAPQEADLRLIDQVAPSGSASWYLRRFECAWSTICDPAADAALSAAREASVAVDRAARLGEADERLTAITPFIPIAQPLRWSLVSAETPGFQSNPRAIHPLNHLR
jgi:peptide/nickel transport system substrate-binding protein